MAPQDASPMQLYSAMPDLAPFLFIIFLAPPFSSMTMRSRQTFIPGGLQIFVSFRRTDLLQTKAFGVARPLVTGRGRRSRRVPVGD
jgi:hypothetical protein